MRFQEDGLFLSLKRLLETLGIDHADRETLKDAFKAFRKIRAVVPDGRVVISDERVVVSDRREIWDLILREPSLEGSSTKPVSLDEILEHPAISLLNGIKKFRDLWQKVPLLNTDEELFRESSDCYHKLVNVELKRLTGRLDIKEWEQTLIALEELYHLGMISWESIDRPYPVISQLLKFMTDQFDTYNFIHNKGSAFLFSRVLRLYVDLEVQRQLEFIQKKKNEGTIRESLKDIRDSAGTMLYKITGLQQGILALDRKHDYKYSPSDTGSWRRYIAEFEPKLNERLSKDNEDRASFDAIRQELKQASDGIKCFPTNTGELITIIRNNFPSISLTSPLSALPGLLSIGYEAFQSLWGKDYADLWAARKMVGMICYATLEQKDEASRLIKYLQKVLSDAVGKGRRSLSYGLLDTLGFIANNAASAELRCQAFLGSEEMAEVKSLAINDFITPVWREHRTLNTLHYLAISIFKNIILNKNNYELGFLLERICEDIKKGKERQSIQLLNLSNAWVTDSIYAKTAKEILLGYLGGHLERLITALEKKDISEVLSLCSRVQAVQAPEPWQDWVKKCESEAERIPDLLAKFFESSAKIEEDSIRKATYFALALFMYLLPNSIKEKTQTQRLLDYTKAITDKRILPQVLQGILHNMFTMRSLLERKQCEKFKELLEPFARAILVPGVYEEAPEFLYRALPSAVFFSDSLRGSVQSTLYLSEIVERRPFWDTSWQEACMQLVTLPVSKEAIPAERLDVRLEYCIDGTFEDRGPLSPEAFALLDPKGHLKRSTSYSSSKSIVNKLDKAQLHLKYCPDFPGNELAARSLYGHLTGQWQMAKLAWFKISGIAFPERYPVLITQTIQGNTLTLLTHKNQKIKDQCGLGKDFNPEKFEHSFSWQVLYALLARLGDAKSSNYILNSDGTLHAIDLEEFLCPAFLDPEEISQVKNKQILKTEIRYPLGIKNILFCMPEMDNPINEKVIEYFLKLSAEEVLRHALSDMAEYNRHLQSEEIKTLETTYENRVREAVSKKEKEKILASILKIEFDSENVSQCYDDFITIQQYLHRAKHEGRRVSHWELLNEVDPALGAIYQRILDKKYLSPEDSFSELTKGLYDIHKTDEIILDVSGKPVSTSTIAHKSLRTAAMHLQLFKRKRGYTKLPYDEKASDGCTELERSIEVRKTLKMIIRSLEVGNTESFSSYCKSLGEQHTLALILQHLDLTSAKEVEPRFIDTLSIFFRSLDRRPFNNIKKLHITGSRYLTDAQFDVLVSYLPNLSWVSLEHCEQLGQYSLISLAKYCPKLSILNIKHLPKLEAISSWLPSNSFYPELTHFTVSHCISLKSIYINAPNIRHLCVNDNDVLNSVITKSLNLRFLNIARSAGITTKRFKDIAKDWRHLYELDISSCVQVHLDQLAFWPKIKTNLRKLRVEACAANDYLNFLMHPKMAERLVSKELVPYLHQLIQSKLLLVEHLPDDKSHWLIRLLSEAPDIQQKFLQYILSRYAPDNSEQQTKIYKWLAKWIEEEVITVLDFSSASLDYAKAPTIRTINSEQCLIRGSMAALPDSRLVISGDAKDYEQHRMQLWDTRTTVCTASIKSCQNIKCLVVLSNEFLAVGTHIYLAEAKRSSGNIQIWNIQTGQCISTIETNQGVYALAVLPDGQLASELKDSIKIWNIQTKRCTAILTTFSLFDGSYRTLALTVLPDGRLASVQNLHPVRDGTIIKLWNIHSKECTTIFDRYARHYPIINLVALPDGHLLSIRQHSINVWNVQTKQSIAFYEFAYPFDKYSHALLPNGHFVISGGSRGIEFLNTQMGRATHTFLKLEEWGESIVMLSDGQLAFRKKHDGTLYFSSFPRVVKKEHAQYIADALLLSSSVTTLIGVEFIENDDLRELIALRVKRNVLLQERRLRDPYFTLAQAAVLVGDEETVEVLRSRPELELTTYPRAEYPFKRDMTDHDDFGSKPLEELAREPSDLAVTSVTMADLEQFLQWLDDTDRICWQEEGRGAPEFKESEDDVTLLLRRGDGKEIHLKEVSDLVGRKPSLMESFLAREDSSETTKIKGDSALNHFEPLLVDSTTEELMAVEALIAHENRASRRSLMGSGAGFFESVRRPVSSAPKIEGLDYQKVPGDDHCLFHAVGIHVGKDKNFLRDAVADYIQKHLDEFREQILAINLDRTPEEYLAAVRANEWADNLEIVVLMRILNRPIVVIGPDGKIRNSVDLAGILGEPIFVCYNGHNHYDAYLLAEGWHARANEIVASLTRLSEHSLAAVAGGAGAVTRPGV